MHQKFRGIRPAAPAGTTSQSSLSVHEPTLTGHVVTHAVPTPKVEFSGPHTSCSSNLIDKQWTSAPTALGHGGPGHRCDSDLWRLSTQWKAHPAGSSPILASGTRNRRSEATAASDGQAAPTLDAVVRAGNRPAARAAERCAEPPSELLGPSVPVMRGLTERNDAISAPARVPAAGALWCGDTPTAGLTPALLEDRWPVGPHRRRRSAHQMGDAEAVPHCTLLQSRTHASSLPATETASSGPSAVSDSSMRSLRFGARTRATELAGRSPPPTP